MKALIYYFSIASSLVLANILLVLTNVLFPTFFHEGIDPLFSIFLGLIITPLILFYRYIFEKFEIPRLNWFLPLLVGILVSLTVGITLATSGLGSFFYFEPFVFLFTLLTVLIYLITMRWKNWIEQFSQWKSRIVMLSFPFLLIIWHLVIFPTCFPATAYPYMPSEIQDRIFKETLSQIHVGDPFSKIHDVIGDRNTDENGYYRASGDRRGFSYELLVKHNTVVFIEIKYK